MFVPEYYFISEHMQSQTKMAQRGETFAYQKKKDVSKIIIYGNNKVL